MKHNENKELKKNIGIINSYGEILRKEYNVRNIGIFGSIASGEFSKNSDIDIMVEFSRPVGFFRFMQLEYFLTKVLKRKVDLVSKKALKPAIKKEVFREVVYA